MHIAFTAERGYVRHAAAMLNSLLEQQDPSKLHLHQLHGPDRMVHQVAALDRWLGQRDVAIRHHVVEPAQLDGLHSGYFHRSIWYRLLLPLLLPDVSRVLYIDADALVLAKLDELWATPLDGALFGAVSNPLYPFMPNWPVTKLGLPSARRYPNSGVLLMDLDAMRREDFTGRIRAYAREHVRDGCAEQDALAAVWHARGKLLHPRWNAQTPLFDLPAHALPWPPGEVTEARRQPAIVHFTGPAKPSHYLCRHPYAHAYIRHRAASPWPLRRLAGRTPLNFLLRRLPLVWEVRYARVRSALLRRLGHEPAPMQSPEQH